MRKPIVFLLTVFLCWTLVLPGTGSVLAGDDGYIYWGEVRTGVYDQLHPYTLNWSGDVLAPGGLNLTTMEMTDGKNADIIINQYGSIGANGLVKLTDEKLEDRTFRYQSGFMSSYSFRQGDLFLVVLSNGRYAKLRIDTVLPQKVMFSYVLEAEAPAQTPAPTQQPIPNPTPAPTGQPYPTPAPTVQPTPAPTSKPIPNPTPVPTGGQPGPNPTPLPSYAPVTESFHMTLVVGSFEAVVQGQSNTLEVAPMVVDGTTLVPLRFVTEALGTIVEWNGEERKITLTYEGKTILLWIDKLTAYVNGLPLQLSVAPRIVNGSTMVPIRFISEHFDKAVSYDGATRTITITGTIRVVGNPGTTRGNGPIPGTTPNPGSLTFPDALYATWQLSTEFSWTGEPSGGVSIFPDGTYIHRWVYTGEKKGRWRYAEPGEVLNYTEAIILMNGFENTDWAIAFDENGNFKMYYAYVADPGGLYGGFKIGWREMFDGTKLSNDPADITTVKIFNFYTDPSVYYGTWKLWVEGGATPLYHTDTGGYATHIYTPGADSGTLIIREDGTYTLHLSSYTQNGTWSIYDYYVNGNYPDALLLDKGDGLYDWVIYGSSTPGQHSVAYADGVWNDGSTMWIIYFIAYQD